MDLLPNQHIMDLLPNINKKELQPKQFTWYLIILTLHYFIKPSTSALNPENMFAFMEHCHSQAQGEVEMVVTVTSFVDSKCEFSSNGKKLKTEMIHAWYPTEIYRVDQQVPTGPNQLQYTLVCDHVAFVLVDFREGKKSNPGATYSFMVLSKVFWDECYPVCTVDKNWFIMYNGGFSHDGIKIIVEELYGLTPSKPTITLDGASKTWSKDTNIIVKSINVREVKWKSKKVCNYNILSYLAYFPVFYGGHGPQFGVSNSKTRFLHHIGRHYAGLEFVAFMQPGSEYRLKLVCNSTLTYYEMTCYNTKQKYTLGSTFANDCKGSKIYNTNADHVTCKIVSTTNTIHVWIEMALSSKSQYLTTPIVTTSSLKSQWIWSRNKNNPFGTRTAHLFIVIEGKHAGGIVINGNNAGFSDHGQPDFYHLYEKDCADQVVFVEHSSGTSFAVYIMDILKDTKVPVALSPALPLNKKVTYAVTKYTTPPPPPDPTGSGGSGGGSGGSSGGSGGGSSGADSGPEEPLGEGPDRPGFEGCPYKCLKCLPAAGSSTKRKCDKCRAGHKPPWCSRCFHGLYGEGCSQLCEDVCWNPYCDYVTGACDSKKANVFLSAMVATLFIVVFAFLTAVAYHVKISRHWRQKAKEALWKSYDEDHGDHNSSDSEPEDHHHHSHTASSADDHHSGSGHADEPETTEAEVHREHDHDSADHDHGSEGSDEHD